jgi:hypothetical protein
MNESPIQRLKTERDEEWRLICQNFFYFLQFVKTEDEELGQIRPFPAHFEYLQKLDYEIEQHQKNIILKSRRGMISWLGMLRQLHESFAVGSGIPDTLDANRCATSSTDEDHAKYLIERVTKVYHLFPDWLKDRNPLVTDNKLFMRFQNGGMMQAFAAKKAGAQGYGFSRYLFDEMAWQEQARSAWHGLVPALGAVGKLLAVSTPNGKFNFFAKIWHNEKSQFDDVHRIKVHWTLNPEHDEAWYKKVTAGMEDQEIQAKFELSFSHFPGDRVWSNFDRKTHVKEETQIILGRPMFLGWDFGYHFPAVNWWQYNAQDQYVGHREMNGYSMEFTNFVKQVKEFRETFYKSRQCPEIHCVDQAGFHNYASRSTTGAASDVHEIKIQFGRNTQIRRGAMQIGTRDNEGPRLKVFRKLLNLRDDGRPGLVVNERMEVFVEGALGGYCYPEKGGEEPVKNEYSHQQDAGQSVVTAHEQMIAATKPKSSQSTSYKRIGSRTGL